MDPAAYYVTLDMSRYQGDVDWRLLREATGIRHVYLRVNDHNGSPAIDPWWHANAAEARDEGWYVGPYIFLFLGADHDAARIMAESIAAVEQVFGGRAALPPMIDHEDNVPSAGLVSRTTRNLKLDRALADALAWDPRTPPIYSAGWYWYGSLDNERNRIVEPPWCGRTDLTHHPFFQAAYPFQHAVDGEGTVPMPGYEWLQGAPVDPAFYATWPARIASRAPAPMAPWPAWTLWQFTSIARLPGVDGDVDVNVLERSWADAMTGGGTLPPPTIQEDDMPKVYDVGGTVLLVQANVATWFDGADPQTPAAINDWLVRSGQAVRGADGTVSGGPWGAYERDLRHWRLAPGNDPVYPDGWQGFRVARAMFQPEPASSTAPLTEAQTRSIVRQELATAQPATSAAAQAGARAGATDALAGSSVEVTVTEVTTSTLKPRS